MKIKLQLQLSILLSFMLSISCNKEQYRVDVPAYIEINAFKISTDCFNDEPNRPPIGTEQVSDAWVYLNGTLQGTYELPAKFPIVAEGLKTLEIRPGIQQNGISATRTIYPFYEFYVNDFDFLPAETTVIEPCLAYKNEGEAVDNIELAWNEGFEGVIDLTYSKNSDTVIVPVSGEDVRDGIFSGKVSLGYQEGFFELISPTFTNLPRNGTPIYLELDYKSNHDFYVGIYLSDLSEQYNLYGIRAKDSWNKVYMDFTETIRLSSNATNFNIFIGFVKRDGVENVEMYLDNLKLVHF